MKKKIYYEAYLTVEASFIVLVAVMILLLLLYWGFFCYDKSVSVQCSYLAALRTSNEWELTTEEAEQMAMEELDKLIEKTFLYMKKEDKSVNAGLMSIETGISGKIEILFSKLRGDNMTQWLLDSKKSAYRIKPSSYIRKYRLLGKAME